MSSEPNARVYFGCRKGTFDQAYIFNQTVSWDCCSLLNTCVLINQESCIIECSTCIVHLFHFLALFDELDLSLQKAPAELTYMQVQRQLFQNNTNSSSQTRITADSGKPGVTRKALWEFEIYLSLVPIYWKLGLLHSLVSLLYTEISDSSLLQWIISLHIHSFRNSKSHFSSSLPGEDGSRNINHQM